MISSLLRGRHQEDRKVLQARDVAHLESSSSADGSAWRWPEVDQLQRGRWGLKLQGQRAENEEGEGERGTR